MLKQYFSDGLLQIAIVLSLLRTDLNHFGGQNNEILNYPEVQDILQGQTVAYLPTSFHNQYNNLHHINGYAHPKHIEDNFYFSSLFHGVTTNIEAFLVSTDNINFPVPQQGSGVQEEPATQGETDSNGNPLDITASATVSSISSETAVPVDSCHVDSAIAVDSNDSDFCNPFPGLSLSKEDLDLIEVLWRQDVDLGVGKEVFDPNLRKELEQEREIELRQELEKREAAEKRERERQQQEHLWLTQNFVRDGETGEWTPIGSCGNHPNYSTSGPSNLFSEPPVEQPQTLEDALNFVGELQSNPSFGQQQQQQQVTAGLSSNQALPTSAEEFQYLASSLLDHTQLSNTTQQNQTEEERLEQSWQEVLQQFFADDGENDTAPSNNTMNATMPPGNENFLMGQIPDSANVNETLMFQPQQQQLNTVSDLLFSGQNQSMSAALSINETRRVLQENSVTEDLGSNVLLQNATLTGPPEDYIEDLDLDTVDEDFQQLMTKDLLSDGLPVEDILQHFLNGADEVPFAKENSSMLGEASSDSAVSMTSGSPQHWQPEGNETMDLSMFDGLEGAAGGSEYDSSNYSHHQSQVHSSNTEEESYQYSCSSYGSPASVSTNCSSASNDTEHSGGQSSTAFNHIHHNHTYHTQPGQTPREVKKYAKKDGPRQKGPQSRDAKRALDLKIPFSFDCIVESPVEEFNDMITRTKLTEAQINLMRDIRRRGKNKVAAQNCRKRKLDQLSNLAEDMGDMEKMRDKLVEERRELDRQWREAKERHNAMYAHIFKALRDEHGHPYDPAEFSLQQSSDGNVFLVRNSSGSSVMSPFNNSTSSSGSRSKDSRGQHKDSPPQKKKNRE